MALMPARLERRDGPLDRVGGAADDGLAGAVDVGEDDVAVGLGDDPLDLVERREARRPSRRCRSIARLAISRPRALTASSAASKDSAPAATSAPYSPRLWPITMSGACRTRRAGG